MSKFVCRVCQSIRLTCLGPIPDSDFFAGRVLERPIPGGDLWRCNACGSMFRHPILPTEVYSELYIAGRADQWTANGARKDLEMIQNHIGQRAGIQRVLDVGCGAGGFLLTLSACVQKFGVEPSAAASEAAKHAGICIAGGTLDDLQPDQLFDAITIIDVIEHVADPLRLLDQAAAHLAPGGSLILATGDPTCVPWCRWFRSRFWYSSFPEHITFPSLQGFNMWGTRRGLTQSVAARIRYRQLSPWISVAHFNMMLVFLISPSLLNFIGRCVEWLRGTEPPRRRYFSPGAPGVFTDHQVVTFSRSMSRRT